MCNSFENGETHLESCSSSLTRRGFITRSVLVGVGLAVAPALLAPDRAIAGGLFAMPSVDDQKKVGDQAAKQVLTQYHEVFDDRAKEVNYVGRKLVDALKEPDRSRWDYKFHVIDSKEVNAFALPGGNLFFFTGLTDNLATEDELAGVVGHEMTHVRKQHWAQAYVKQQERDTFLNLGLSLFHASSAVQSIAGLADQAISLKYSRGEESQADQGGLQDMVAAGYNPQGMIDMFNVLLQKAGNGGTLGSDFLSNHPLTTDRIKAVKGQIASLNDSRSFPDERPLRYTSNKSSNTQASDQSQ